jgi:hypothetical protein
MHDRQPDPTAPERLQPTAAATRTVSSTVLVAAAGSLGAGLVHAAAAGTHAGADTLVRLFAVTAAVQVAWAALAVARASRPVLALGVLLNGAAVVAWALSRTRGLPWPAELEVVEEAGTQDRIAAALGAVAALGALAALVRPSLAVRRAATGVSGGAVLAGAAVLALAVPGMAASHTHGASHEHGHADGAVAADHGDEDADHAAGAHAEGDDHAHDAEGASSGSSGPIISLTDARVTDDQRAAAQQLIDDTQAGMARFSDVESVQAAGYISIGDGVTGYEHFINVGYIADDVQLDPEKIESIVFTVAPDGTRTLASAMYILQFGKTMDDVPEIAGELTSWHDHQNLCWEGARVVGTTDATGSCQRGTFRATPPMLHVWMTEHPCGPFAGIEGSHGSGCAHDH